jgi:hypothetical protein
MLASSDLLHPTGVVVRIVAWNIAHQSTHKPIHKELAQAVAGLKPDLLLFNEYVEYPEYIGLDQCADRAELRDQLAGFGLKHHLLSVGAKRTRHFYENRVIAYSKSQILCGTMPHPDSPYPKGHTKDIGHATSFLHFSVPEQQLDVVGFRQPDFGDLKTDGPSTRLRYWQSLLGRVSEYTRGPTIVVGDFNTEPHGKRRADANVRQLLTDFIHSEDAGWSIPDPLGDYSFLSCNGKSRIDHVLLRGVKCVRAEYVKEINGSELVGITNSSAISDHAPLVLDICFE